MWSDRIRANDAGRGGWGDQWSQGSTHGVRAVQGSQGHPTTRRHTRDLNPRRNPTPCAQCQNRQRSGWRSRENAQGRRARHCLTRRWPWCTRTRTRTPSPSVEGALSATEESVQATPTPLEGKVASAKQSVESLEARPQPSMATPTKEDTRPKVLIRGEWRKVPDGYPGDASG